MTPAIQRRMEKGKQICLSMEVGGQLNPQFVEWLMGWPLNWTSMEPMPPATWVAWQGAFLPEQTDCKPLETDKCPRQWPLHGKSSQENSNE